MLASTLDEDSCLPTGFLKSYTLDKFVNKEVYAAVKETDDTSEEIFMILMIYSKNRAWKETK